MTTFPSSGRLMAPYNYHQPCLGSSSSNSSCRSAEHPGEAIPDHLASFFFQKSTLPYNLALEAMREQPGGQPGKANTRPQSRVATSGLRRH
ncbi:unnamed protein product [Nyctereutes procyonoides]|uniref:(raccoon dog) hypothetical protein n=1 Tax=Nyctereutes procyonoides TaxID=34880 RepID=A0A811YHT4_NYCPR|nr:unnamed protein product [Nyctereutes procyonoides]